MARTAGLTTASELDINRKPAPEKSHTKRRSAIGAGPLYIMMIPSMILLVIYSYVPMAGLMIAFNRYDVGKGLSAFWASPWCGLGNFKRLIGMTGSIQALLNTLNIAWWKMATMFVIPVIISLLLNEVRKSYIKRGVQTIIYLPHFLSWVIMAGILKDVLSSDGVFNNILMALKWVKEPITFLIEPNMFPHIIIWSNVWKEFGFSTIVFLAAITGIDPSLYEAAIVDGANRWRQTLHVTLPGMKPIIILVAVLSLGNILNAGFDQIFNLYSVPVYKTGDIIDTLVYRVSMQGGDYSLGTALGLFRSVVSLIFVSLSYWLAYRLANYEIF